MRSRCAAAPSAVSTRIGLGEGARLDPGPGPEVAPSESESVVESESGLRVGGQGRWLSGSLRGLLRPGLAGLAPPRPGCQ